MNMEFLIKTALSDILTSSLQRAKIYVDGVTDSQKQHPVIRCFIITAIPGYVSGPTRKNWCRPERCEPIPEVHVVT